jgi:transitional endoplasmic reticulum ATPase
VTVEMEQEYEAMGGRLKQQASAIQPLGFIAPGMLPGRTPKNGG